MALKQFGCKVGEGINTDMRAVRKDYFLDHDHSSYVDQWDWEKVITAKDRNLDYLKDTVRKIWKVIRGAGLHVQEHVPGSSRRPASRRSPRSSTFFHAEDILDMYPDLPAQAARDQAHPGAPGGLHHRHRLGPGRRLPARDASRGLRRLGHRDHDARTASPMHGLNGDILVWNPVTKRRHELTSMGIRVTKETLVKQIEIAGQIDFLELPYHQAILNDQIPLSIGGGIGQARTYMYLLRTAHLGEVTVTVWPKQLKKICAAQQHPRARVGPGPRDDHAAGS